MKLWRSSKSPTSLPFMGTRISYPLLFLCIRIILFRRKKSSNSDNINPRSCALLIACFVIIKLTSSVLHIVVHRKIKMWKKDIILFEFNIFNVFSIFNIGVQNGRDGIRRGNSSHNSIRTRN